MPSQGRPRASCKWTPEKIEKLWLDADIEAAKIDFERAGAAGIRFSEPTVKLTRAKGHKAKKTLVLGKTNKRLIAGRLKKEYPEKYKYISDEQLEQLLRKRYLRKKTLAEIDQFNACALAHRLGETKPKK
jgi:hypothetical protein